MTQERDMPREDAEGDRGASLRDRATHERSQSSLSPPTVSVPCALFVGDAYWNLVKAAALIVAGFRLHDHNSSLDEAFIWEPPIDRRPLITFGDVRALDTALKAFMAHPNA